MTVSYGGILRRIAKAEQQGRGGSYRIGLHRAVLNAGLAEVVGGRTRLTPEGRAALAEHMDVIVRPPRGRP